MSNVFRIYPRILTHDYIQRESLTANFANILLVSIALSTDFDFFKLVHIWGVGNYLFDFICYGFIAGFLLSYIPSLIALSDLKNGIVAPLNNYHARLPKHLVLRSLTLALLSTLAISCLLVVFVSLFSVDTLPWLVAALIKLAVFGLLGIVVVRVVLRESLALEH